MEVLYPRCCGLDVHKSSITACVLLAQSGKPLKHIRRFGCTTGELRELVLWLQEFGVEHVAMESTGVYWKPVWNVLESHFQIVLANAQHIKAVPGRKTDTKDCQWIAELLQHGLLRGSFIPPVVIRDLRDLTRARTSCRRSILGLRAGFKKYSRMPISSSQALPATRSVKVAERFSRRSSAEKRIRNDSRTSPLVTYDTKIPQLQAALEGKVREHHRFLLQSLLRQLGFIETEIELLDARLDQLGQEHRDLADALNRWITVPGVDRVAAWSFIAEIGTDCSPFPTAAHLASWAGVCPGNNESAGKRISSKIRKGSPWLRRMACQSAWAAARTKNTYLSAQFKRLAARRGRKCAIIAVAHSILVIGYHLQRKRCVYSDLGGNYFDRLHADGLKRYLVKRLESLGHSVTLQPRIA